MRNGYGEKLRRLIEGLKLAPRIRPIYEAVRCRLDGDDARLQAIAPEVGVAIRQVLERFQAAGG